MAITYEPIATTTLSSAAASITFSSISSAYTDLRVVVNAIGTATGDPWFRLNANFATNYSYTEIGGNGATASSYSVANDTKLYINLIAGGIFTTPTMYTIDLFSYAGSTNKTSLITASQDKNGSGSVGRSVGLWRNTAAITQIQLRVDSTTYAAGTTATLYGILKA